MPSYQGREYAYSIGSPEGHRDYYDADGNYLFRETDDPNPQSNKDQRRDMEYGYDPVTGERYGYEVRSGGKGPRGDKRDARRTRRAADRAARDARTDYYAREGTEALGGIDDPWNELAGQVPTYEELMGDEYTATLGEAEADPMAIAAQRAALQRMGQVARTGYTAEDRAVEQQARSNAAQFERQQRDAIMQQAATRGMQGAGTTLGAQLSAQQSGANRNSQASLDMAANAQRRALQALAMQNSAAGQMRGQSFGEDTTRRSAVDEANRYMIEGQRSASRDQFGMRGQVAQGQSQAAAQQAEGYLGYKQDAAGQKTKGEKAGEYATGAVSSVAEFF